MAPVTCPIAGRRVWVAGHNGMAGSAIVRQLQGRDCEILTVDRRHLDLTRQADVEEYVGEARPELVFLAAGRVGGILANRDRQGAFLYENLMIAANVMEAARRVNVRKLLFLGSSCIYPRDASQPMPESALLSGPLEPTNEGYAIAKIAGIKLAEKYRLQYGCDYISLQPTNLYGPGDNFDPQSSHVPAALARRFYEAKISGAKSVEVWGTGTPKREFLHVDDLADAAVFAMERYSDGAPLNVGVGEDITIADFARLVADATGYRGEIVFDPSKPDGTPRKVLDVSRINEIGWKSSILLREGVKAYCDAYASARVATGRMQQAAPARVSA